MILPDSQCEEHGEVLVLSATVNRGKPLTRKVCLTCRREGDRRRYAGLRTYHWRAAEHCRNGHLKRFHYRLYGGTVRCVACAKEQGRLKR